VYNRGRFHKASDREDAGLRCDLNPQSAGGARSDRADGDHRDSGSVSAPAAATKFSTVEELVK